MSILDELQRLIEKPDKESYPTSAAEEEEDSMSTNVDVLRGNIQID